MSEAGVQRRIGGGAGRAWWLWGWLWCWSSTSIPEPNLTQNHFANWLALSTTPTHLPLKSPNTSAETLPFAAVQPMQYPIRLSLSLTGTAAGTGINTLWHQHRSIRISRTSRHQWLRLLSLLQVVAPYKSSRASSQARINPGSASTPIVSGASNGVHVPA